MKKKNIIKAKQIGLSNVDILRIQQTAKAAAEKTKEKSTEKAFLYIKEDEKKLKELEEKKDE